MEIASFRVPLSCLLVLSLPLGCAESGGGGGRLIDVEGEDEPVRQWAAADMIGDASELPFFTHSLHMDACTPDSEGRAAFALVEEIGLDAVDEALDGRALVQLYCADERLLRTITWIEARRDLEEPCGGTAAHREERPRFIRATPHDIGTVEVQAHEEPHCVRLVVCNPIVELGLIEVAHETTIALCQDPGRAEARVGSPAAWTDCPAAALGGTDGDLCEFEDRCVAAREVDAAIGRVRHELVAWCSGGLVRFAPTLAILEQAL